MQNVFDDSNRNHKFYYIITKKAVSAVRIGIGSFMVQVPSTLDGEGLFFCPERQQLITSVLMKISEDPKYQYQCCGKTSNGGGVCPG